MGTRNSITQSSELLSHWEGIKIQKILGKKSLLRVSTRNLTQAVSNVFSARSVSGASSSRSSLPPISISQQPYLIARRTLLSLRIENRDFASQKLKRATSCWPSFHSPLLRSIFFRPLALHPFLALALCPFSLFLHLESLLLPSYPFSSFCSHSPSDRPSLCFPFSLRLTSSLPSIFLSGRLPLLLSLSHISPFRLSSFGSSLLLSCSASYVLLFILFAIQPFLFFPFSNFACASFMSDLCSSFVFCLLLLCFLQHSLHTLFCAMFSSVSPLSSRIRFFFLFLFLLLLFPFPETGTALAREGRAHTGDQMRRTRSKRNGKRN